MGTIFVVADCRLTNVPNGKAALEELLKILEQATKL